MIWKTPAEEVPDSNEKRYYKLFNANQVNFADIGFLIDLDTTEKWCYAEDLFEETTSDRKYLPTLGALLDRLSITQLKEVYITEYREEYAKEIQEILHDIDIILKENNINISSKTLRHLIILGITNSMIWFNESEARKGNRDGNKLFLTHTLNGIRNRAINKIQEVINGRKDLKVDCCAAEFSNWEPSWNNE